MIVECPECGETAERIETEDKGEPVLEISSAHVNGTDRRDAVFCKEYTLLEYTFHPCGHTAKGVTEDVQQ